MCLNFVFLTYNLINHEYTKVYIKGEKFISIEKRTLNLPYCYQGVFGNSNTLVLRSIDSIGYPYFYLYKIKENSIHKIKTEDREFPDGGLTYDGFFATNNSTNEFYYLPFYFYKVFKIIQSR